MPKLRLPKQGEKFHSTQNYSKLWSPTGIINCKISRNNVTNFYFFKFGVLCFKICLERSVVSLVQEQSKPLDYENRKPFLTTGNGLFDPFAKTNFLPLRFRKAGRVWGGGARETHCATCHDGLSPSKSKEFLKSPCF